MSRKTGIILAWDKSTFDDEDFRLFESVIEHVDIVKVGLEAMSAAKDDGFVYESVADAVSGWAYDQYGKKTMWDAKLHDIGTTVDKTIRNIIDRREEIIFLTVHAGMSDVALDIVHTACAQANIGALAVTMLTDIDERQCRARFIPRIGAGSYVGNFVSEITLNLARAAYEQGIRGFVCSPKEVALLRGEFGEEVMLVAPDVRPAWAPPNDQTRVMTPAEAAQAGADYIVVGRPILGPPQGVTPVEAARRIRAELEALVLA